MSPEPKPKTEKRTREGEQLKGKYQLEKLLGRGGMGEVYRARNVAVNRTVAIKILLGQHLTNKEIVTRFLREAQAANAVHHQNIVEVLDIDKDDTGIPFIVQEYLDGISLSRKLRSYHGEGMPVKDVLKLLIPAIEAIGEAHAKGVVHRDIKPSNIFLAKEDGSIVAKVVDFGISKMTGRGEDVRLTTTSSMMGSPAYMSPEQIENPKAVDVRSDVWSIGVLLYEVLSGRLPFYAEATSGLMIKICTEEPISLSEAAPGVPDALSEVVSRCMQRNPYDRFIDASQVAQELKLVEQTETLAPQISGLAQPESRESINWPTRQPTPQPKQQTLNTQFSSKPAPLDVVEPTRYTHAKKQDTIVGTTQSYQDADSGSSAATGGIALLGLTLVLVYYFSPSEPDFARKVFGGAAGLVLLGLSALSAYLGTTLVRRSKDSLLQGLFSSGIGLFAMGGSLLIGAAALMMPGSVFTGLTSLTGIVMPLGGAVVAAGLAVAGFNTARYRVFVSKERNAFGMFLFLLAFAALIIGLQLLFHTLTVIAG